MNLKRMGALLFKDLWYGSRNYIFVFALVMPVVLSLVLGLLFGTIFSEKPSLGLADAGDSQVTQALLASDFMTVTQYESEDALLQAVNDGVQDMGISFPADFDATLQDGQTDLTFYTWGQSLVRDRAIIGAGVTEVLVETTGRETPISVDVTLLGEQVALSWQERLLPLVVLMSVVIGGVMVPATSIVQEREKKTLRALTTSPLSMAEVFLTKGLVGAGLALFSGLLILGLNGGWGQQPALLIMMLILSGIFSAAFGVLLGTFIKDQQTLFATLKGIGILLYAPGLIGLFPDVVPAWVMRIFPTYYIMQPVVDISQNGLGLSDIAFDVTILLIMIALMIGGLALMAERLQVQEA